MGIVRSVPMDRRMLFKKSRERETNRMQGARGKESGATWKISQSRVGHQRPDACQKIGQPSESFPRFALLVTIQERKRKKETEDRTVGGGCASSIEKESTYWKKENPCIFARGSVSPLT